MDDRNAQASANNAVANVALRGEQWWFDADNSLRTALDKLDLPPSVKLWVGDVAAQAWTEGAITAVQEYGDEMRAADAEFDVLWAKHMRAVNAWRAAHPGNDLVMPDMGQILDWLLGQAGINGESGEGQSDG